MSFGWDYPPGTPGPSHEEVQVKCLNPKCPGIEDEEPVIFDALLTSELGAGDLDPEECPECGGTNLEVI